MVLFCVKTEFTLTYDLDKRCYILFHYRLFQCDNFAFGKDESSRSVRAAYSDELNRVFDQVYLPVDCIPGTPTYTNMFKCMNNAAILYNRNQPCHANITPTTTSR